MNHLKKISLAALCFIGVNNANAQSQVTFYTSMGNIDIVLTDTLTPVTVDSFIARVKDKFYDGLIFHRVINNFMIQGGDPLGNGTGGPGYTLPDEFSPKLKNIPGALAMANAGPNTSGSQFYINLVTNSHLDNHYTVFGMVTKNFSVVQNIGKVPTDGNDKPLTDVVIDSIRMTHFPTAVKSIVDKNIPISVYPNPAKGVFTIALPAILTQVQVINISGQVVYHTEAKDALVIDMRDKPKGQYTVRISNAEGKADTRLLVL